MENMLLRRGVSKSSLSRCSGRVLQGGGDLAQMDCGIDCVEHSLGSIGSLSGIEMSTSMSGERDLTIRVPELSV